MVVGNHRRLSLSFFYMLVLSLCWRRDSLIRRQRVVLRDLPLLALNHTRLLLKNDRDWRDVAWRRVVLLGHCSI